jgi:hypothetical protein
LVLPGLRFLVLTGFYGAYVLATGLPRLMKIPSSRSLLFVLVIVVCAFVLVAIAIEVQRAIFGTRGIGF